MIHFTSCFCALLLARFAFTAPAPPGSSSGTLSASTSPSASVSVSQSVSMSASGSGEPVSSSAPTSTADAPASTATFPTIDLEPNNPLWNENSGTPAPIRGTLGSVLLGPDNLPIDKQNPDLLAPPTTDHGSIANAKWPFSLSHNRLQDGGWARQENVNVMPIATQMSSVNMRLEAGAVRELHWHKTAEWAYVLKGRVQVTAIDPQGKNYVATVDEGDLWYFPAGIPHSLQATDDNKEGAEFVLVFDTGTFSEDSTFLLTDWLAHIPAEVIAKNFGTDIQTWANVPEEELYIFPATLPEADDQAPKSPQGVVDNPYSFAFSKVKENKLAGGSVKVVDSSTFKISKTIAAAEVTVEPGAMRELHWHPTEDEWSLFLEGTGRVTIFAAQSNARTFDYQAGDIGYVPGSMGHYVENTGNTTLRFLEIFRSEKYEDVSLMQWLALIPAQLVKSHLGLSDKALADLKKEKQTVVAPVH
ncbi:hypothetical protein AMATHDRAFT_3360 [Amanita thiersii Skay4041]|uniref:Cupin type-1 domain-containing protein n=1 Tax=Amanita thiersii Skay4041 TaxID=703135 RepID=A0A2A9NJD1_9AGAR|nr:hypothetical protein AMATHDRAFT_3360 [Amanita thiersii Skay4041]